MKKFIILADAGCDLGEKFLKEYDIEIIQGHLVIPEKGDVFSYQEWKDTDRDTFYTELKKNPSAYATSPPNVSEYKSVFEKAVTQGQDVLCITISGGISGAVGFASTAKKEVLESHPDADIRVVDSRRFGPGFGLMTVYAAKLRNEGKSLEEVERFLEENKNRFHQAGWLDDLSFVAKKGRITHPKAFFGTLAGVKPIGEFDSNGLTTVLGKAKGAKAAYSVLLDYIEATVENPEDQIFFIAQTNRLPQATLYKTMIEERFHPRAVIINDVFPFCGINIGPGLMAAYYIGKPISDDLSSEREIIEKLIST